MSYLVTGTDSMAWDKLPILCGDVQASVGLDSLPRPTVLMWFLPGRLLYI